jgi:hypothetical protein
MRYDHERREARLLDIVHDLKRVARLIRLEILDEGAPRESTIDILDKLLRDIAGELRLLMEDRKAAKR